MLMNAASPQKKGDVAKIISPVFPFISEGYCLTWFYHMLGNIKNFNKKIDSNKKLIDLKKKVLTWAL